MIKLEIYNKNKFIFNILIGLLITTLPILIILIQILISLGYWGDFISIAVREILKYSLIGVILSMFYTFIQKYSKKLAIIFAIVVIIVYYIIMFTYIITIEYFRIVGPPI